MFFCLHNPICSLITLLSLSISLVLVCLATLVQSTKESALGPYSWCEITSPRFWENVPHCKYPRKINQTFFFFSKSLYFQAFTVSSKAGSSHSLWEIQSGSVGIHHNQYRLKLSIAKSTGSRDPFLFSEHFRSGWQKKTSYSTFHGCSKIKELSYMTEGKPQGFYFFI